VPKANHYYVYLLTNWNDRVMYVGFTNDLKRRVYEHRNKSVKGFTEKKYNVNKLVISRKPAMSLLRLRERKKSRNGVEKKNKLVFGINPSWSDLSEGL
jgi:putative endonuclease